MNDLSISFLITYSTENETLERLLNTIYNHIKNNLEDEMVIIQDSNITNPIAKGYISQIINYEKNDIVCGSTTHIKVSEHPLNNNYSDHKNFGMKLCNKTWIMQLDADECPTETLIINIKDIITLNPDIEAFWIPRINDFRGVTEQHAMQWGWKLSPSTHITHEKIIDTNSDEYKFLKKNGYILEETKI